MNQQSARTLTAAAMAFLSLSIAGTRAWSEDAVETIALIRHGEKPQNGLGQLDCQGLNRALALPPVIAKIFGKPSAIFAPDPSHQKEDDGASYDYVRPLATVEPTAIYFGLPIDASIGFSDADRLRAAVQQPMYHNATVLVAWEHKLIEAIARALLEEHGADPAVVPKWDRDDFDGIYVVTIVRSGDGAKATFTRRSEGLDGQPEACPR